MSIGILGFIVWSWVLASPHSDMRTLFLFAVSWNGLVLLIGTLNGKSSISYTQSAGNQSLYSLESNTLSASETTRETSFNFSAFRQYYNTLFENGAPNITDNWLAWFVGFVEGLKKNSFFFLTTQARDDALSNWPHMVYDHLGCFKFIMRLKFRIVLFKPFF